VAFLVDHFALATFLISLLLFAGILLSVSGGRRLAERLRRRHPERELPQSAAVEGALFALLGLLLAFAFSGAATRYDTRRQLIVQEANAIGTAYLRVDLLNARAQAELRPLYREYVESRLATYAAGQHFQERIDSFTRDQVLQARIWKASLGGVEGQLPNYAPLIVMALNDMFDITTTRYAAAFQHPPLTVYLMLFAVCFITALLVGYGLEGKDRPRLHLYAFSGVLAITIYVTADVEFPNLGFIRVDDSERLLRPLLAGMK